MSFLVSDGYEAVSDGYEAVSDAHEAVSGARQMVSIIRENVLLVDDAYRGPVARGAFTFVPRPALRLTWAEELPDLWPYALALRSNPPHCLVHQLIGVCYAEFFLYVAAVHGNGLVAEVELMGDFLRGLAFAE